MVPSPRPATGWTQALCSATKCNCPWYSQVHHTSWSLLVNSTLVLTTSTQAGIFLKPYFYVIFNIPIMLYYSCLSVIAAQSLACALSTGRALQGL